MKILIFASLTPPATANYLVKALRDGGHDIFVCSDFASPLANVRVRGGADAEDICSRHKLVPDLVLFIEGGTMRLFPTGLERMSCLTAWYGIDTHMDYAKHLRIGRLFDVTFIAQKEFVERLRQDGLRQLHWLPLGFAPELMPASLPPKSVDIAHVGSTNVNANPARHALLAALKREFPSSNFGPASPKDMGILYASARVVFNRSVNNDVNMRFFEAAGAGAALVTDSVIDNGLEILFDEGVHYLVYRDEASLLKVVRELLADPARSASMGQAARQRVLERHTYAHRAASLLDVVRQSSKQSPPRPEDYFPALLALNRLGAALDLAGRAMTATTGSAYRKVMGKALALVLRGLAGGVKQIERIRDRC